MKLCIVGQNIEKWANKYLISLENLECPTCKKYFKPDTSIAFKGYRGVTLSNHGCGINMPFRVVPIDKEKIEFWELLRPEEG